MMPVDTLALPPALQLNPETLNEFSAPFYQYERQKSLMDMLAEWLFGHARATRIGSDVIEYTLIGIGAVAIVVVLVLILKNVYFPSSNKKKVSTYGAVEIEADNEEFDRRIRQALDAGHFAEATRWLFLKSLKRLNEQNLISFDTNKTVYEYAYELADNPARRPFNELARRFAFYHYGQATVDELMYRQFSNVNDELLNSVANEPKK